jgi:hypothetical protein
MPAGDVDFGDRIDLVRVALRTAPPAPPRVDRRPRHRGRLSLPLLAGWLARSAERNRRWARRRPGPA